MHKESVWQLSWQSALSGHSGGSHSPQTHLLRPGVHTRPAAEEEKESFGVFGEFWLSFKGGSCYVLERVINGPRSLDSFLRPSTRGLLPAGEVLGHSHMYLNI